MAFGKVKVDQIIYTSGGGEATLNVSGLIDVNAENLVISGTISGVTGEFQTVLAPSGNFSGLAVSTGDFTYITGVEIHALTLLSGTTITGQTGNFDVLNVGGHTSTGTISGNTITGQTGNFDVLNANTATFVTGVTKERLTVTGDAFFVEDIFVTGSGIFGSGVYSTGGVISGITVQAGTGDFTNITGSTVTGGTGNFALGGYGYLTISNNRSPFSIGLIQFTDGAGVDFYESGTANSVGFDAPTGIAGNIRWALPSSDASVSGYALVSDASGTLSWGPVGSEQLYSTGINASSIPGAGLIYPVLKDNTTGSGLARATSSLSYNTANNYLNAVGLSGTTITGGTGNFANGGYGYLTISNNRSPFAGLGLIQFTDGAGVDFYESGTANSVGFNAPTGMGLANIRWRLPSSDASVSGYALVSDGATNLSWAPVGGGQLYSTGINASSIPGAGLIYPVLKDNTTGSGLARATSSLFYNTTNNYLNAAGLSGGFITGGTGNFAAGGYGYMTISNTRSPFAGLGLIQFTDGAGVDFYESGTANSVGFNPPTGMAAFTNIRWRLPSSDASVSGYALVSDGATNLSWAPVPNLSGSTLGSPGTTTLGVGTAVVTGSFGASGSTILGFEAGAGLQPTGTVPKPLTSGVIIGAFALSGVTGTSGNQNTVIGWGAGANTRNPSGTILIGYRTATSSNPGTFKATQTNIIAIGNNAGIDSGFTLASFEAQNNVIVGHEALNSIYDATGNISIGNYSSKNAGGSLFNTTVVGNYALESGNTVSGGVYIGHRAGISHSGTNNHIVIGEEAYPSPDNNTSENVAIGYRVASESSGFLTSTVMIGGNNCAKGIYSGTRNVAIGSYIASNHFVTAWTNSWTYTVAVGSDLAKDDKPQDSNVYVGSFCGSTISGPNNVLIGKNICSPTGVTHTGGDNILIGSNMFNHFGNSQVSKNVSIGIDNASNGHTVGSVLVGYRAGQSITTGDGNTLIGYRAGRSVQDGFQNTAVGYDALISTQVGYYNTAVGYASLTSNLNIGNTAVGNAALFSLTTGGFNTAIGNSAGYAGLGLVTGSNCTFIGHNSEPSAGGVNNEITLGNNLITTLRCNQTSITSLSDERDKTNIADLDHGIDFIKRLRPVKFEWARRDPQVTMVSGERVYSPSEFNGKKDYGFIAQELQTVETELNTTEYTSLVLDSNPEKLEAAPLKTYPILVQAVKQLIDRLEAAEQTITQLQGA